MAPEALLVSPVIQRNALPPRGHRPELDGVRGLAIVGVLLTHGAQFYLMSPMFPRWAFSLLIFGWSGVDLFFGLSGFLITGILLSTREATNRVSSFYLRRVLRIAPIYYLTLIALLLLAQRSAFVNEHLPPSGWNRWAYFFYLQNMPQLWGSHPFGNVLVAHFWSLAVEEQFYLAWPLIVWMVPERFLPKLCVVGIVGSFVLRFYIVVVTRHLQFPWMIWTPTRGEALLFGGLLAILVRQRRATPRILGCCAVAGASLLGIIALLNPNQFWDTGAGPYMYTIGYTGINLLAFALIGSTAYTVPILSRTLQLQPLRAFGIYSYGLYVYHVPIYMSVDHLYQRITGHNPWGMPLLRAPAYLFFVIALTCLVAWLSFRFIEQPILSLKDRFKPRF